MEDTRATGALEELLVLEGIFRLLEEARVKIFRPGITVTQAPQEAPQALVVDVVEVEVMEVTLKEVKVLEAPGVVLLTVGVETEATTEVVVLGEAGLTAMAATEQAAE